MKRHICSSINELMEGQIILHDDFAIKNLYKKSIKNFSFSEIIISYNIEIKFEHTYFFLFFF